MYYVLGTVLVLNTDRNVLVWIIPCQILLGHGRPFELGWISVSEWYLLLPQYFSCSHLFILSGLLWISNELIYVNHWEESKQMGRENSPLQEYKCYASHFYLSLSNHFPIFSFTPLCLISSSLTTISDCIFSCFTSDVAFLSMFIHFSFISFKNCECTLSLFMRSRT